MQMILPATSEAPPDPDVFNLIGSLAVPRSKSNAQNRLSGLSANVAWLMGCVDVPGDSIIKGEIQTTGYSTGTYTGIGPLPTDPDYLSVDQGVSGVWVVPHDFSNTYYVRATLGSGSNPTSGSGMDTWLSLVSEGANRFWLWTQAAGVPGTTEGILKLEISDDSNGNNIVATGFYKGTATVAA